MAFGRVNVGGGKKAEIENLNKTIQLTGGISTEIFAVKSDVTFMSLNPDWDNKTCVSGFTEYRTYSLFVNDKSFFTNQSLIAINNISLFKESNRYVIVITYTNSESSSIYKGLNYAIDYLPTPQNNLSFKIRSNNDAFLTIKCGKYTA